MTTDTPSRRERLRTATVTEIKDAARRLLVAGGPSAISLRAIARDMGMTAPAIYRYFPSLDALVGRLTADLYDELRRAIEAARDECPGDEPLQRLAVMAHGFRAWGRAHPAEFALMFGSPVPGVTVFEADSDEVLDAGTRFGAAFLDTMAELHAQRPFSAPPQEVLDEQLRDKLGPHVAAYGDRLPLAVVYVFLAAWTRLYGIVAMEVFGHLRWAMTDVEPLFEMELTRFVGDVVGDPPAQS
jgi:AcrR family transcriptional regulator